MDNYKEISLRELQLLQMDMVIKFFDFCDHHNLNYTFIGGSMLGAVRHRGFIPWDDDVDIGMPRPDYDRMLEIAKNSEIAPGLKISSGDNDDDFALPFTKIFDSSTLIIDDTKEYEADGNALWIDVMPFDGLGDDLNTAKNIMLKEKQYYKAIGRSTAVPWKRRAGEKGIVGFLRCSYRQLFRIVGYDYYKKKIIKLARSHDYNESTYVAIVVWGLYGVGEIIKREEFEKYTTTIFENRECKSMGCWDAYLKGIYGDYMKLPPVEKRKSPHKIKLIRRPE